MQAKKEMEAIKVLSKKNNIFVGQEYETGRIINGKKEYAKMFEVEALPNTASNKDIATRTTNITVTKLEGYIKGSSLISSIPFIYSAQNSVYHYFDPTANKIVIRTTGDMSMYGATETLYYTKN